jgi:hypothetical protein
LPQALRPVTLFAMELVALALVFVFVFVLVSRVARRKSKTQLRVETPIDKWAQGELTSLLASELDIERADLAATLGGSPDPDVVTKLEAGVRKVEIGYERAPGGPGSVDARLEIQLENGTSRKSQKRFAWAALPADISAEFEQSGAAHVYRAWVFPWQ